MPFLQLPELVAGDDALTRVVGRTTSVLACAEPGWAAAIAGLVAASDRRPTLVATPTSTEADRLANDLAVFLGNDEVATFPAWETLPFERVSPSLEAMGRRVRTIWQLSDPETCPSVIVAPLRALIQQLAPEVDHIDPFVVGTGDILDVDEVVAELVRFGYRREAQVEHRGEMAVRGSIIDVYPATADTPLRIDLWGDEVDRLTEFAVADQRSTVDLSEVAIFPCRELLISESVSERAEELVAAEPWGREQWERLRAGELFDGMESWLPWLTDEVRVLPDLLSADARIVLIDPRRMRDRGADLMAEEADLAASLARTWGATTGSDSEEVADSDDPADSGSDDGLPRLHQPFDRLLARTTAPVATLTAVPESPDVAVMAASGWEPPGEALTAHLQSVLDRGDRLIITADGRGTAARLAELLGEWGIQPTDHGEIHPASLTPGAHLVVASVERGFSLPGLGVSLITEAELTGRRRSHRRARQRKRQSEGFFDDLSPGSYVVHHQHGVGRFAGMVKRAIGGHERDYLMIDYRGDDKLYLPSDQIDLIRPYSGGDSPSLHRLGGSDFAKTKAKVRSEVAEIAQELVVLYQQRVATEGIAFAPDSPWQAELEAAFPFELTPDQASAVEATKADMETETPMDRLVVGDVGFGKTEIAVRAAFKAVQSGYQVAVLVPTTLLAQQHFATFSERYAPFPLRVEVLSRFLTNAQAKAVVQAVADGEVDVLIGTHRILSEDVRFAKLGLLVVDEEQRFGVSHKEALKHFRQNVDVLTLTATPIPRTLEMSLTGIRDLSVLNTPPADRQPILTYVGEYDERPVVEAIRRELLREGQVFFVHNRVRSIEKVAGELRELVPEARIAVAHGQMDEGSLEGIVLGFWEGEYDVLVCTTIIESGIDMPTVNTLLVDRAERLGLGQLHQLRGRVGRSASRAYAYLFTRPEAALSEESYERLKTIGETTELGSGFRIAMRDLEIRGAGNLLGTGQSGHIAAVGYDLYCQMVSEAVAELSGVEADEPPPEIKLDLPIDASLPADYVSDERHRLEAYRRLASVTSREEVEEVRNEWLDRYGPIPELAVRLLEAADLRAECARLGIRNLVVVKGPGFGKPEWMAKMGPVRMRMSEEVRFERLFRDGVWKPNEYGEEGGELHVGLKRKTSLAPDLMTFLETMFPQPEAQPA